MKRNMGLADKIIRLIISAVIIALYATGIVHGTLAIVLLIIAAIFVLTSLIGICPLYIPLGINTCSMKKNNKK
jgi:hypothetical protein